MTTRGYIHQQNKSLGWGLALLARLAGVVRIVNERIGSREVLHIESMRNKTAVGGPAVKLKRRWLEDKRTRIVWIERHLDLMGD